MKKYGAWLAVLLVAVVVQSAVLPFFPINNVHADILLLVVASTGLLQGNVKGGVLGFAAGLLQDVTSGTIFGLNTFSKMVIGYLFGSIERKVFKEQALLPVVVAVAATLLNYLLMAVLMHGIGYRFGIMSNMAAVLLPMLLYNVILAIPVYKLICRIMSIVEK